MNTSESRPMFSSSAIARMLAALSVQLATKLAMSPRFSTMSGCLSNGSSALASSFFEQTARMTPRRAQFARIVLERDKRLAQRAALAEHDAVQAVVADDAAPERVVEVEHQAFERAPLLGREPAADQIAIQRRGGRSDLLLRAVPQPRIVPARRCRLEPPGRRAPGDRRPSASAIVAHAAIQPGDERGARARQAMFIVAEQRQVHRQRGLLNDRTAESRRAPAARCRGSSACISASAASAPAASSRGGDPGGQMVGVERQQHRVRPERVQRRGWVGQFLPILAVIAFVGVDPDVAAQAGDADRRQQMGQCR